MKGGAFLKDNIYLNEFDAYLKNEKKSGPIKKIIQFACSEYMSN